MERNIAKPAILFLCTGNSCRSQMAEAILRHEAGDKYEALSAGLDPHGINPLTLEVLKEACISTEWLRSKSSKEFLARKSVRLVVFVCSHAEESCPSIFPFAFQKESWPFEDPAAFKGSDAARLEKFREVRDLISGRIKGWLEEQQVLENKPK